MSKSFKIVALSKSFLRALNLLNNFLSFISVDSSGSLPLISIKLLISLNESISLWSGVIGLLVDIFNNSIDKMIKYDYITVDNNILTKCIY